MRSLAAGLAMCAVVAHAGTITDDDVRDAFVNADAARAAAASLTPKLACSLPSPLPSGPPTTATSWTFSGSWGSSDAYTGTIWREPCGSSSSLTTLYVRITPTKGTPFVCSSATKVLQGGTQYNVKLVQSSTGSSFCGNVYAPVTLAVDQYSSDPIFDRNGALTMVFEGVYDDFRATIGAWTPGIEPVSGLWCNCGETGTGYSMNVRHGVLVVTVFSYLPTGEPLWYLVSGPIVGNVFTGTLDKYRDGQCISCAFKPAVLNGNDGVMRITFTSTTTGIMELPGRPPFPITPLAF